jgi:microcystin-dependent protein
MFFIGASGGHITFAMNEAKVTSNPYVFATFCDSYNVDGHNLEIYHADGALNGTTPVDIIGEPDFVSFNQRIVKNIAILNIDTVAHTFLMIYNVDSGYALRIANVQVNEMVHYEDGEGWYVTDVNGARKVAGITNALLDGNVHNDTVANTPARGALIVGNSTPKWDELTVGADTTLLQADSAQTKGVKWQAPQMSIVGDSAGIKLSGDSSSPGNSMLYGTNGSGTKGWYAQPTGVPTGGIIAYGVTTAPSGFLLCDGSAVSRSTYATLFSTIGTSFGAGDGSTTFNVPDLRSRTIVGTGQGSGLTNRTLAATGGEESHALSSGELATHAHAAAAGSFMVTSGTTIPSGTGANGPGSQANTATSGSGTPHNTMPPFQVCTWIIKT